MLIALGVACFGKLIYQYLFKRVLSKNQFIPANSAIKGLGQFIDEDGELFLKLGREQQLHQLRSWVQDSQIPLVVVRGESGAGKSSLLRAGLFHVLKNTQHKHVYCEALTNTTARDLLKAVNQKFGTQYQELDEILFMPYQAVIVLDQLEQLNPDNPNDQPIFKALRQIATELRPPHNITWCVAFRPDYADTWLTQVMTASKIIPEFLSVELFTPPEAHNVVATLADEAGLTLDQAVVENFIQSVATPLQRISPVSIGIGLQVLNQLAHESQVSQLSLHDYHFAGGSQGLFASFLYNAMQPLSNHRETLYKILLDCVDLSRNQRIAEGKTEAELATNNPEILPQTLAFMLESFSKKLRILEKMPGNSPRYRLAHEIMIPALRQLSGKLLSEVADTELRLQTAYQSWLNSGKNKRYLLSGKDLSQVFKHKLQLDLRNFEQFVTQSQRRKIIKTSIGGVTLTLLVAGYVWWQLPRGQIFECKTKLDQLLPKATEESKHDAAYEWVGIHIDRPRYYDTQLHNAELKDKISAQKISGQELKQISQYIAEHINDFVKKADIYCLLARIALNSGDENSSLAYLEKALTASVKAGITGNPFVEDELYKNLAEITGSFKSKQNGLAYLAKLEKNRIRPPIMRTNYFTTQSIIKAYTDLGDKQKGEKYLKRVSSFLDKSTTDSNKPKNYLFTANFANQIGEKAQAINYLEKAATIIEQTNAKDKKAENYLLLAQNYAELKNMQRANGYLIKAESEVAATPDGQKEVAFYLDLAEIYATINDAEKSQDFLAKAISLMEMKNFRKLFNPGTSPARIVKIVAKLNNKENGMKTLDRMFGVKEKLDIYVNYEFEFVEAITSFDNKKLGLENLAKFQAWADKLFNPLDYEKFVIYKALAKITSNLEKELRPAYLKKLLSDLDKWEAISRIDVLPTIAEAALTLEDGNQGIDFLGRVEKVSNNFRDANKLVSNDDSFAELYQSLAESAYALGRKQQAFEYNNQAIKITDVTGNNPKSFLTYQTRAKLNAKEGRYREGCNQADYFDPSHAIQLIAVVLHEYQRKLH